MVLITPREKPVGKIEAFAKEARGVNLPTAQEPFQFELPVRFRIAEK